MRPFDKILIANRGEIALRVMRTARALGYRTVAVYSAADAGAPHVVAADQAVAIGPAPAAQSYLSIERVLGAARLTGAGAVHPGYGFLAENADFAAACSEAGLTFIGPPPEAIRLMGNKRLSKLKLGQAGIECIPGYHGKAQSDKRLTAEAAALGTPLMVKAAAGGGGRGLRLVREPGELPRALKAARSEARNAFGSDELILEKALEEARHIEIQVFADGHGNALHLGERDCSVQRRHQKVIEEAPSPALTPELRRRMGEAAVAVVRAIDYLGAGTVEFLLTPEGDFYFLEMNTRLQVEHPVTELVTGLDLVAWQLKIAAGEPLPLRQDQVRLEGHAIEARLYAEDPERGFLPQSGRVLAWEPAAGAGIRVDHGLATGLEVSPYSDPLLAKIVAYGENREAARRLQKYYRDIGFTFATVELEEGGHRDDRDVIFRNLVRNNGWVMQRYAPPDRREGAIREVICRYARIAVREGASKGYAQGIADLVRTLARQPARQMSGPLFDRFVGLAEVRATLGRREDLARGTRAAIVDEGKNASVVRQVVRELGLLVTDNEGSADVAIIGTLSPGPMLDARDRRASRHREPICPWDPRFDGLLGEI